jgi:peptidoglycan/LPS O-acetylase OafA/YrhL
MAGSRLFRNGGADVVLLAVLAAVGLLLRWVVAGVSFHMEAPRVHAWHVAEGVLWTSVLLLLLLAPLRTKPLWCNRVLAHIGILSYSIYLWHLPVMLPTIEYLRPYIQASVPQAFAWMTLLSVVFLGLCELSYRWIERPFLERKARLAA